MASKKLSVIDLQKMKEKNEKVVWVTAYDFITAQLAEQAGMDMILVGDSLGMCIYGYDGTIPVTMDQCIYHCEAVRRAAPSTFIIGDMPFGSYQINVEEAVFKIKVYRQSFFFGSSSAPNIFPVRRRPRRQRKISILITPLIREKVQRPSNLMRVEQE